ncbi:hypothetical protein [uncultured Hydrogenophaga sp.]|uniref:hypothetical protein n=1 Tax=uncultured Hydrogenophaga sp. TaxID=199683 RepID=UPI002587BD9A|nr:hypothetical protein [uncultured Hydrogenophaga sp.]
MKIIQVELNYRLSDESLSQPQSDPMTGSIPFPFRVVDSQGALLAEGAVDSRTPSEVFIKDSSDSEQLFVRLMWPTGNHATKVARFEGGNRARVVFSDQLVSVDPWSSWAASRIPKTQTFARASRSSNNADESLHKFQNVWLRLWQRSASGWSYEEQLPRHSVKRSESIAQLDLDLSEGGHLLQLGGQLMPFVFVSLPGNGTCRVLLTPNASTGGNKNLPLKVVVSSFRPKAEMLVEFLSRDSMQAAKAIKEHDADAWTLLQEKYKDPVSAIAGAYYLLRSGEWRSTPIQWFENLYASFPWSSDAALIRCVVDMRLGLRTPDDARRALRCLSESIERGIPLFEEAHRINIEAYTLLGALLKPGTDASSDSGFLDLQPRERRKYQEVLNNCQRLAVARAWTGAAFSYFGAEPDKPTAERLTGKAPTMEAALGDNRIALVRRASGFSASNMATRKGTSSLTSGRRPKSAVTYLKDL